MVPTPMATLRTPAGRLYVGGLLAVLVGLFLPWARVPDVVSITGIETDDGKLFLVLVFAAALLAWARIAGRPMKGVSVGMLVVAGLMVLLGFVEVIDITASEEAKLVGLKSGLGLWLDFVGSLATFAGAILFWRTRPRRGAADAADGPPPASPAGPGDSPTP